MGYREDTGANRRKLQRLPVALDVTLTVRSGLLWRGRTVHGKAVDYNRYGLAFVGQLGLRPRTRVALDIAAGHMVLRRVNAQVVSSVRAGREYRIGLRFYRKLSEFADPGPGHPLHFLLGLEETLQAPV